MIARALVLVVLAAVLAACSTGGSGGNGMRELPSNGAGPFRKLDDEEIAFGVATPGRNGTVEAGMVLDGPGAADAVLFYAFAAIDTSPLPMDAGPDTGTFDAGDTDAAIDAGAATDADAAATTDAGPAPDAGTPPARFEPRAIFRTPPSAGPGFADGTVILSASAEWEGGEVFDPWALTLPDGRVRLYYASPGGIGAADAPAPDGTFTAAADAALLAPDVAIAGGALPRRPTVVHDGTRFVLYYEAGPSVWVATSPDGLAFTRHAAPIALDLPRDAGITESRLSSPGAVRIRTTTGRDITRLYFTSHREDGTQALALAASEDGLTFERAVPVVFMDPSGEDHEAFPSPWVRDARVTLLYFTVDRIQRRTLTRALAVGVSPGSTRFSLPE